MRSTDQVRVDPRERAARAARCSSAPATVAAEPSADDPAATVNGMLDTLVAKDFAGIGAFVCAERRAAAVERFDLEAQFAALGEGVDVRALFAALTVSNPDRTVEVTANDGTTATVAVGGSIVLEVDDAAAREFTRQLLEAQGLEVTDALLDEYTPQLVAGIERPQDLTDTLTVIVEDGVWLVCDDLLGRRLALGDPRTQRRAPSHRRRPWTRPPTRRCWPPCPSRSSPPASRTPTGRWRASRPSPARSPRRSATRTTTAACP